MINKCKVIDFHISQINVIPISIEHHTYPVMHLLQEKINRSVATNYPYAVSTDLIKVISDTSGAGDYIVQFLTTPTLNEKVHIGSRIAFPVEKIAISVFPCFKGSLRICNGDTHCISGNDDIGDCFGEGDFYTTDQIKEYTYDYFACFPWESLLVQFSFYSPVLRIKTKETYYG